MKIIYNGKEDCILEIINNLPGETKSVRKYGNSIIIPTIKGADQVFVGDTVVIDGDKVSIIEK